MPRASAAPSAKAVLRDDLVALDLEPVEPAQLDRAGRWVDPISGPPSNVPLARHWTSTSFVLREHALDRHLEVGDRGEELGEVGLDLLGPAEDPDGEDVLDALLGPVLGHRGGIARDHRVEVGADDLLGCADGAALDGLFGGHGRSLLQAPRQLPDDRARPPPPRPRRRRARSGCPRSRRRRSPRRGARGRRSRCRSRPRRARPSPRARARRCRSARPAARRARRSCRPARPCRRSRARRGRSPRRARRSSSERPAARARGRRHRRPRARRRPRRTGRSGTIRPAAPAVAASSVNRSTPRASTRFA